MSRFKTQRLVRTLFVLSVVLVLGISTFGKMHDLSRPMVGDSEPDPVVQVVAKGRVRSFAALFQAVFCVWVLTRPTREANCQAIASLGAVYLAYHLAFKLVGGSGCGCFPRQIGPVAASDKVLEQAAFWVTIYMGVVGAFFAFFSRDIPRRSSQPSERTTQATSPND